MTVNENTTSNVDYDVLTDSYSNVQYNSTLEIRAVYNPRNPYDNSSRIAQPQLHMGMLEIPQLSPSTEAENHRPS